MGINFDSLHVGMTNELKASDRPEFLLAFYSTGQ